MTLPYLKAMDNWNWNVLNHYAGASFGNRSASGAVLGVNFPITPLQKPAGRSFSLTDQQNAVVECDTDLKINAVAGSGKTSTLIEYARRRGVGRRGLYLAFNRTVRQEAQVAFARKSVTGVAIHTAHSLAHGRVIKQKGEVLTSGNYTPFDVAARMQQVSSLVRCMPPTRRKAPWTAVAAHSLRLFAWYCNHTAERIDELDYGHLLRYENTTARRFGDYFGTVIRAGAEWLWNQMEARTLKVTHDYYLKKFQLMKPKLNYDYILFDEGQDASPTMLDVFERQQHARRVIVGDTHQQIYGFRHAVNSLESLGFPTYALTQSFRFPASIAEMAKKALNLKQYIHPFLAEGPFTPQPIEGLATERAADGCAQPAHLSAVIGRTNLQLVAAAIQRLCLEESIGSVYFEGNFETYTFMDNGAGLLEMVLLGQNRQSEIRNPLLRSMGSLGELSDYIDQTGDTQMKTALELVMLYQDALPYYIQCIRDAHLPSRQRGHADLLFSTVHRCKGLEYEQVILCDDFIDKRKLLDFVELLNQQQKSTSRADASRQPVNPHHLVEELNMLYVALTRSKGQVCLPASQYYLEQPSLV